MKESLVIENKFNDFIIKFENKKTDDESKDFTDHLPDDGLK